MGCTFKGYNLDDYGVIFEKMPAIKKPKRRAEAFYVENKDGFNSSELGYDGYTSDCVVVLTEPEYFDFLKMLLDGNGQLIRNDNPARFQNAKILNEVKYDKIGYALKTQLEFSIEDPFFYLVEENESILTAPGSIVNEGTYFSKPLLKITGLGLVTLSINGRSISYNFDTPYVFIDSNLGKAYYESSIKNRKMSGEFPILDIGENEITWIGSITEVRINKRTRYL